MGRKEKKGSVRAFLMFKEHDKAGIPRLGDGRWREGRPIGCLPASDWSIQGLYGTYVQCNICYALTKPTLLGHVCMCQI